MRLVTGVATPTEDVAAVGDGVALWDTATSVAVGSFDATVVTRGDGDVTGTSDDGISTGTDELPHATVDSNVEVAMETIAAR